MFSTSMNDFKIEKVLGKGSFGSVYLVTRKEDQKIYALKSVIMEKLNKKEQENSVNEVRILASVNHPNVIGYKEAFWDDQNNTLNIVMEYADDGDLQTKIQKMKKNCGFFEEDLIWSYSIQMIEGLKALHDKKIMHRDLKSANIFLVKNKKQCKLGDMNVSKVIKEKVLRTQTGTPYYASPEVWNDRPYSYKSDLWSIGCVIYELCALRPPFKGKDLDELYINVCKGKVDRINKVYSDSLWKMIMMLLQVDVNKRVNCDQFLNHPLIVKKIKEMKEKSIEFKDLEDNKSIHDGYLLNTINFKDLKEIKSQLPTRKNYENSKNIKNYYSFGNKDLNYNNNYYDYYKYLNNNINNILNNNIFNNYKNNLDYKSLNNYEKKYNKNTNPKDILNIINDKNSNINNKYSEILNQLTNKNTYNITNNNQKPNIINDYLNSNLKINYNKYNIKENIFHTDSGEGNSNHERISLLKKGRDNLKINSDLGINLEQLDTEEKIKHNEKIIKLKKEKNKIIEKIKESQSKTIEEEKNDYKLLLKKINLKMEGIEHKFNDLYILNTKNNNNSKKNNIGIYNEKELKTINSKLEDKYFKLLNNLNNKNNINNNNLILNNKKITNTQILNNNNYNSNKNIKHSSSSGINIDYNASIAQISNNKRHHKNRNSVKSISRPLLRKANPQNNNYFERSKTPSSNYNNSSPIDFLNKKKEKYITNITNYQNRYGCYKQLINQISTDHINSSIKSNYINDLKNNINSAHNNPKDNKIKRINKRLLPFNKKKKKNYKDINCNTKISKNRHISEIPTKRYNNNITINNNLNIYDINNISNQYTNNYPLNSLKSDYDKYLNDINLTSINNSSESYIKKMKTNFNEKPKILINKDINNIANTFSSNNISINQKYSITSNDNNSNIRLNNKKEYKSNKSFNFINPSSAIPKNYTLLKNAKKLNVRSNSYRISSHEKNYINKKRKVDYRYDLTEPEQQITNNLRINSSKTSIPKIGNLSLLSNGIDLLGISSVNNGNTFLKNIKSNDINNHFTNINKSNKLSGRYYLNIQNVHKYPQIFNNYYSINGVNSSSFPIKVINVFNNK